MLATRIYHNIACGVSKSHSYLLVDNMHGTKAVPAPRIHKFSVIDEKVRGCRWKYIGKGMTLN